MLLINIELFSITVMIIPKEPFLFGLKMELSIQVALLPKTEIIGRTHQIIQLVNGLLIPFLKLLILLLFTLMV